MEAFSSSLSSSNISFIKISARIPQPMIKANMKNLPNNTSPTFQTLQKRNSKKSFVAIILNTLDDFICAFLGSPLHHSIDPKHVLSGNNAPVNELPPTACEVVEGSLPSCLDGAYIRNGPNPQFIPKGAYHFFDGDGMLHMIRISKGKATFCSRYVNTYKHILEREIGYPFFPSVFSSFNGIAASTARLALSCTRVLTGQFDPLNHGFGVANTSLALFPGRGLFALCESDLPYALKVTREGDIITLGRHGFQTSEPFSRMTAHPKIDEQTGESFAYTCNITPPFLKFFRINPDGRKQKDVPIQSIKECTLIHDFALTENYAIFPDTQVVVNPSWVLRGRSPVGISPSKVPRLGVIPRYAENESEMWWVNVPGLNIFHCVNAWEEDGGDTIVVVASNALQVEHVFWSIGLAQLTLEKITINVKAKTVQRHPMSKQYLELGVINPAYAGKKNRYVYATLIGAEDLVGLVKLDLSLTETDERDCTVASHLYGPGCCGGEPYFISRGTENVGVAAEEDDGYLVTYVHDKNINGESKFVVMDAKSASLDIIAVVRLPCRVPCGFHGLFVSETDLNKL